MSEPVVQVRVIRAQVTDALEAVTQAVDRERSRFRTVQLIRAKTILTDIVRELDQVEKDFRDEEITSQWQREEPVDWRDIAQGAEHPSDENGPVDWNELYAMYGQRQP